jgi:hypothetical protein
VKGCKALSIGMIGMMKTVASLLLFEQLDSNRTDFFFGLGKPSLVSFFCKVAEPLAHISNA